MEITKWVKEKVRLWEDGLITPVELISILEKGYNNVCGGYNFSRRKYTGYDYDSQCWITIFI